MTAEELSQWRLIEPLPGSEMRAFVEPPVDSGRWSEKNNITQGHMWPIASEAEPSSPVNQAADAVTNEFHGVCKLQLALINF